MRRSNSTVRRVCAVGTTIALVGLSTGLGIMTATTASAAEPTTASTAAAGTGTGTGTESTASTPAVTEAPTTATDAPTEPAAPTTDAPATDEPAAPATTAPASAPSKSAPRLAAAAGSVAIDGDASVGSKLTAEPTGFTAPANLTYAWTIDGATVTQGQSYVVKAADAGKVVIVTVTNTQGGIPIESESAQTDPISQAPVFVDEQGNPVTAGTTGGEVDSDLTIPATAGEQFSYTFRATGSPKPVLALSYYYSDDDHDGETPADQLPEGVSFDPATGVLSGSTTEASYYDFAVTATSGSQTITQTVELDVEAAAPAGIEATAVDRAAFIDFAKSGFPTGWFGDEGKHDGTFRSWIIKADGSILTEDHQYDVDGWSGSDSWTQRPGGTPTVPQGGTLLLSGDLVDEFGNAVSDDESFLGTTDIDVRSNVASDVVKADSLLGDAGFVGVTFPHASVHRLTVSAADFSTAFDVQVTPAAVVTVPKASTPVGTVQRGTIPTAQGHGRLAYTGADETTPLAWALGLLVAGASVIGIRALRRRRAQR